MRQRLDGVGTGRRPAHVDRRHLRRRRAEQLGLTEVDVEASIGGRELADQMGQGQDAG